MAYDTTEAVAKFLSGFQMKITNRERDTVAPDYYVKYSLTLSKGGKDFSTTSITARNSAPPPVTWNSPSDALLRNTKKRKGRSLTTSPPANGVCILSTPASVTVSMVA